MKLYAADGISEYNGPTDEEIAGWEWIDERGDQEPTWDQDEILKDAMYSAEGMS